MPCAASVNVTSHDLAGVVDPRGNGIIGRAGHVALKSRRRLIPATGFYEWQKLDPLLFRLTSKIGSDVSGPALP